MTRVLAAFVREEDGAITIDWVALTAGILILGIAVVYTVFGSGVTPLLAAVNEELKSVGADVNVGDAPDFNGGETLAEDSGPTLVDFVGGEEIASLLPFALDEDVVVVLASITGNERTTQMAVANPDGSLRTLSGDAYMQPDSVTDSYIVHDGETSQNYGKLVQVDTYFDTSGTQTDKTLHWYEGVDGETGWKSL